MLYMHVSAQLDRQWVFTIPSWRTLHITVRMDNHLWYFIPIAHGVLVNQEYLNKNLIVHKSIKTQTMALTDTCTTMTTEWYKIFDVNVAFLLTITDKHDTNYSTAVTPYYTPSRTKLQALGGACKCELCTSQQHPTQRLLGRLTEECH